MQKLNAFAILESKVLNTVSDIVEELKLQTTSIQRAQSLTQDVSNDITESLKNLWDGTIATGLSVGEGTENKPYLISKGSELAYIAEQVNAGTTYEGVYFQLASDIDLNGREWTPIGNRTNSFRGIFNGSGYKIANANITITSSTNEVVTYGFFGSIGGGSSYATIKNIEFDGINVNLSVTRSIQNNSYGYKIGVVTGVMYKNSQITNVAVKNSNITHSGTISAVYTTSIWGGTTYYKPIVFVGGIAGDAVNSETSETDPGSGNRVIIDNCYSDVDIIINVNAEKSGWGGSSSNTMQCFGQVNLGGVIGRIKSQSTWPTNCLYNGTITSSNSNYNGLVGPIFGAERVNTSYTSTTNMNTIWNGDSRNSLTMSSYYMGYSVFGTSFTSTVTSGNAGNNTTYRRSKSNSNIGYVQGINKGRYLNNKNTMLTNFNNNLQTGYISWKYEDDDLTIKPTLKASVVQITSNTYQIQVEDEAEVGIYTYEWYINENLDTTITGDTSPELVPTLDMGYDVSVIVSDGARFTIVNFKIPKLYIAIEFDINETNNSVTASLTGTALPYANLSDYTYTWYEEDIAGTQTLLEGQNSLTLTGLKNGMTYRLVATNSADSRLSAENAFDYGDRIVVFVDYNSGNDNNDGYTPETAVKTLSKAYQKLSSTGTRNENIIVMMGNYSSTDYFNSTTRSEYAKNACITGKYAGKNYSANWTFGSTTSYFKYLTGELTLMHLTLNGSGGSMYLVCQGYSVTVGNNVTMTNYANANPNQGLLGGNAPAFHLFAGWYQYNETTLPRTVSEIVIKSGTYGRIVLGGTPGTSDGQGQENSHDFMGSSMDDCFNVSITVDIQESTTASNYDYDINLLTGGSACGNNYSRVVENIKRGSVGRVLGGSIGDSQNIPTVGNTWNPEPWSYPNNTFLGETTINVSGGRITELYGGCLGRNMGAINNNGSVNQNYTGNTCDSYFYGEVNINISGGTIENNIYGAGAGGVTGYSENSSDNYKSYGENFETSVNINISGGNIQGNIYGGGYGYTEYLNQNVTAEDGGALYGDSNIIITGSPTIIGNIYGAGCGYNYSNKPNIAQMIGNSIISISGNPNISGAIYGAGAGISGYENMAKLTGNSTITIEADLETEVFGGGNIAQTVGTTTININSGTHTSAMYGGGNIGVLEGTANVNINGGSQTTVFGGGNEAEAITTNVYINEGTTTNIYGGGNAAAITTTNVFLQGGTAENIFGGSNQSGNIETSNVTTTSGTATYIYGGNNKGGTVTKTNIIATGGNLTNLYGGNNAGGTATETEVRIENGTIENTFGGGNQAITGNTTVYINGGTLTNVYGGGNEATTTTARVYANYGNTSNIYGGGNKAGVTTNTIELKGGVVGNVFGGSNQSGDVEKSDILSSPTQAPDSPVRMTVTYTANDKTWQQTTYPTVATLNVEIINTTDIDVEEWNAKIIAPDSTLLTEYTQSNIEENNGVYSFDQENKYYGINSIPAGGSYSLSFEVASLKSKEEFTIETEFIGKDTTGTEYGTVTLNVGNIFGGNNEGGITQDPNIEIQGGTINNIYGGGNRAIVPKTNVRIEAGNIQNVFGGGNAAAVENNTSLTITGGNIKKNIYGGGDEGIVYGNTNVNVKDAQIKGSAYAGGNGITAVVHGNTNITIEGKTIIGEEQNAVTAHTGSVFGGGNAAATGTTTNNNSTSTVNIIGATIYSNVYGGANTSVVYGYTNLNIGYDTIQNENLTRDDLYIRGTIFGGGEANASGSEVYDYSFISVTKGINIDIDGNGYQYFKTEGSIFGSGNASSTTGESYIIIKNYGTADNPHKNISIQRATTVILDNSAISLSGATDRTNEYSSVEFTLSRIDELKIKNNSTLYLDCGANLLKKLSSLVDEGNTENLATVIIDKETGATTRNVDNRIYMLEGKNLNIATNESVTAYGEVDGMTFLGIYTNKNNPSTSTGLYNQTYNNGDEVTNAGTFLRNSYVQAAHETNHNIEVDGFYTNYNEEGYIKTGYVGTTPEEDVYYIWLVGEEMDVTIFQMSLTASKYATLGTYELSLTGFSKPNTKFQLIGFASGLEERNIFSKQKKYRGNFNC